MASFPTVYIVSATSTPIGVFLGSLSSVSAAPRSGGDQEAVSRAKISEDQSARFNGETPPPPILSAGIGQAPRAGDISPASPTKCPPHQVSKVSARDSGVISSAQDGRASATPTS